MSMRRFRSMDFLDEAGADAGGWASAEGIRVAWAPEGGAAEGDVATIVTMLAMCQKRLSSLAGDDPELNRAIDAIRLAQTFMGQDVGA